MKSDGEGVYCRIRRFCAGAAWDLVGGVVLRRGSSAVNGGAGVAVRKRKIVITIAKCSAQQVLVADEE